MIGQPSLRIAMFHVTSWHVLPMNLPCPAVRLYVNEEQRHPLVAWALTPLDLDYVPMPHSIPGC